MMQLMVLEASLFLPRAVFPQVLSCVSFSLMCLLLEKVVTTSIPVKILAGWHCQGSVTACTIRVWAVNSFHCLSIAVQLATCQNLDQVTKFTSLFTYLYRNMLNKKTVSHLLYRIIQSIFHSRSIPFINLHWFIFILKERQQHFIYSRYPH